MVGQQSQSFEYQANAEEAFRRVEQAFRRIGKLQESNRMTMTVRGSTRYGLQKVKLRVAVHHRGPSTSVIEILGSGDDIWGGGARKGADKLISALG